MNYKIQGLSIHVEVHGTAAPTLVFLHHWGGTSRTWRKVTGKLEGQFKRVSFDARGWEKSDKTLLATNWQTLRTKLSRCSKRWDQIICPGWTLDGRRGRAARRIA